MHIYSFCGLWNSSVRKGWSFLADKAQGGRLRNLDGSSTIEKLKLMVSDDFGIDLTLSKDENLNREARVNLNNQASGAAIMEGHTNENSDVNSGETNFDEQDIERDESDDEKMCDIKGRKGHNVRFALLDIVKKGQHFSSKILLKATFEICAMKHNFDYKVVRSDTKIWNKSVRTASEKTIGNLIMHKYDGVKAGPKCNDIIEIMRGEHGIEVSKSLAWDARRGLGIAKGWGLSDAWTSFLETVDVVTVCLSCAISLSSLS
ncbi:hypothetical protein F2Q69_00008641 [Brassica cretica]|uniref:Uncharacterized protein n=1 Tax=Brassica cretica TaxID=69181 RepID=A0A8S9P2H8_BRACR|nr:hypothetical protein F2Q69_00008641 [Brassica cretica]